ncbi:nuclear transport factor 2 family protein [Streptomyces sp. AC512_CC834]|uniref:nuclear transport factor 2 family protein n=1 Tax=Streptomyces sp. AC512_CC834 TaxID=2823691 RepID=UPI0027E3EB5D|nr:nuclear transport factor 2 family protein [Streptomyces sp. AC512_CC834]
MSQVLNNSVAQATGDLYAEVQAFYARQMRRADSLDIEGFAETFTDDGEVVHADGGRTAGRAEMIAAMRARLPRYKGVSTQHWFGQLLIERLADGALGVSYYTLVAQMGEEGLSFQPTYTVDDVLVREPGGSLRTRSRIIRRSGPAQR